MWRSACISPLPSCSRAWETVCYDQDGLWPECGSQDYGHGCEVGHERLTSRGNYVDDLCVPKVQLTATTAQLKCNGLHTKPPADMATARVLGLQLSFDEGMVQWTRRSHMALTLPGDLTHRQVVSWCGKLVGHYPVCNWLCSTCNWVSQLDAVRGGCASTCGAAMPEAG